MRGVIFEVKNWVTLLPSEKTVLKLLGNMEWVYLNKFLDCLGDKKNEIPHNRYKLTHPLALRYDISAYRKFINLVDLLYEKGLLKDKRVTSISGTVNNFLKAISGYFGFDPKTVDWYRVMVKELTGYLEVPSGVIIAECEDPHTYVQKVRKYVGGYDAFGDRESCLINNPDNDYVWDLVKQNDGKVITIKVFDSYHDYKAYQENPTIPNLVENYKGGARFLLYKSVILDEKGREYEVWVSHNAYNTLIPFTPYFWYLVLKAIFLENFGRKPFMVGFGDVRSVFWKLKDHRFIYVNLYTNGVHFTGFVVSYDKDIRNVLSDSRITVKEHCPVCGNLVKELFSIGIEYPEYGNMAVYGDTIVGCKFCIRDSMVDYFNSIHENGLGDEDAYVKFKMITGSKDFDEVYF